MSCEQTLTKFSYSLWISEGSQSGATFDDVEITKGILSGTLWLIALKYIANERVVRVLERPRIVSVDRAIGILSGCSAAVASYDDFGRDVTKEYRRKIQ